MERLPQPTLEAGFKRTVDELPLVGNKTFE
jgi:hypothetical protein